MWKYIRFCASAEANELAVEGQRVSCLDMPPGPCLLWRSMHTEQVAVEAKYVLRAGEWLQRGLQWCVGGGGSVARRWATRPGTHVGASDGRTMAERLWTGDTGVLIRSLTCDAGGRFENVVVWAIRPTSCRILKPSRLASLHRYRLTLFTTSTFT